MSMAQFQFDVCIRHWRDLGDWIVQFEAALGPRHPAVNHFPRMLEEWRKIGVVLHREYRRPWEEEPKPGERAAPAAAPSALPDPAVLQQQFGVLNISVRARKGLMRLNVQTVGELIQKSGDELLAVKNFGPTSLEEVRKGLGKLGLKLRGE